MQYINDSVLIPVLTSQKIGYLEGVIMGQNYCYEDIKHSVKRGDYWLTSSDEFYFKVVKKSGLITPHFEVSETTGELVYRGVGAIVRLLYERAKTA